MSAILVYVTFPSQSEAKAVASAVIQQRLAACANICAPHDSVYWWDGAMQNSAEVAVIFKTMAAGFDALRQEIVNRHSNDTPCIVAVPIEAGHAPFLRWIEEEVR